MLVGASNPSAPRNPSPQSPRSSGPRSWAPSFLLPGCSDPSSRVRCCPLVGDTRPYLQEAKLIKYFYLQRNKNKPSWRVGPGPHPAAVTAAVEGDDGVQLQLSTETGWRAPPAPQARVSALGPRPSPPRPSSHLKAQPAPRAPGPTEGLEGTGSPSTRGGVPAA